MEDSEGVNVEGSCDCDASDASEAKEDAEASVEANDSEIPESKSKASVEIPESNSMLTGRCSLCVCGVCAQASASLDDDGVRVRVSG